jgi:uncharacterized protein
MKRVLHYTLIPVMLLITLVASGADIPFLTGRVNDNANILSAETRQLLADSLKAQEDRTGNQVVVLTVSTLDGENIEDYANKVFNDWKLGQKGRDNGILIVVVPDDRRMRIEVGYGLEGTVPDLLASRIIQEVMTPRFRDGDYNGGVIAGANSVLQALNGEQVSDITGNDGTASDKTSGSSFNSPDMSLSERILIGAFIFGIIGLFTFIGLVTPRQGWFLYVFLIPFWAVFPIVVLGTTGALVCFIIYITGFPVAKLLLKKTDWYAKAAKDIHTKGRASIGGFMIGVSSSGSSWSSGGGGGFSGGGGSSGGGGASGGW